MLRAIQTCSVLFVMASLAVSLTGCSTALLNADLLKPSAFKPALMDGHGTEQRVINEFTDALAEDKESAFRRIVSTRFEQKALRSPEAFSDLEIVNLPHTKLEVSESTESADGHREVVAKEEKSGTKYQFLIVRDPEKHRWVVDDVMIRQQKKGTRASRSSVAVMDLLLTVREFLETWQSADRDAILQSVSSELREPLQQLPESWVNQFMNRVSAEYETGMARRPVAQMNESDAVVKLPSKNGFLLLKVLRQNEQWLVSDIEIRKRRDDDYPGSILRQARAMNAVTEFLSAYAAGDQERLRMVTAEKFYQNSLRIGNLSMIPLPEPSHAPDDFEIQSFAGQLTVIIPDNAEVIRMNLTTPELSADGEGSGHPENLAETKFVVGDVIIYDRQTQQQRNLKSAFTAPARAMLFLSALHAMDVPILKQISSNSLSVVTWDRIDPTLTDLLPIRNVPAGEMTLLSSRVRGDVTELEFMSAEGRLCSVIMRDENGILKVDDVQFPGAAAQVASLRNQVMLAVPLTEFASAWRKDDLESVKRCSSQNFNRLVWSNVAELPREFERLPEFLLLPVQQTQADDKQAMIHLAAAGQPPVTVTLLNEHGDWVIDEISLRPDNGTAFDLRRTLREEIARQFLVNPVGDIQRAVFSDENRNSGSGVVRAVARQNDEPQKRPEMPQTAVSNVHTAALPENLRKTPAGDGLQPDLKQDGDHAAALQPKTIPDSALQADSSADNPLPPKIRPRAAAEKSEHDGVIYFNGAARTPTVPVTPSTSFENEASAGLPQIADPSQYPIDISPQ